MNSGHVYWWLPVRGACLETKRLAGHVTRGAIPRIAL